MYNHRFSLRSKRNMQGVDSGLIAVAYLALRISPYDFGIVEGVRTRARQRELVDAGVSWTMNSKHLTGNAIDIGIYINGKYSKSPTDYKKVNKSFERAARFLGIKIKWGGNFRTVFDGPHYETS